MEHNNMDPRLHDILTRTRGSGSPSERDFVTRVIDRLPGVANDTYGNRWLWTCAHPETIISVHTDTVSYAKEDTQAIDFDGITVSLNEGAPSFVSDPDDDLPDTAFYFDPNSSKFPTRPYYSAWWEYDNCLGADDGAGLYAAMRMIEAGVPALYIFHRDEECGGKGSRWIASSFAKRLEGRIKRCIALDRRGTSDVITHQRGERCCSQKFATALCNLLDMGHEPTKGVFTDSANYTDIIPECTNISVGYENEHTSRETLNVLYLEALIDRLCTVDLSTLPTSRKAAPPPPRKVVAITQTFGNAPVHSKFKRKAITQPAPTGGAVPLSKKERQAAKRARRDARLNARRLQERSGGWVPQVVPSTPLMTFCETCATIHEASPGACTQWDLCPHCKDGYVDLLNHIEGCNGEPNPNIVWPPPPAESVATVARVNEEVTIEGDVHKTIAPASEKAEIVEGELVESRS